MQNQSVNSDKWVQNKTEKKYEEERERKRRTMEGGGAERKYIWTGKAIIRCDWIVIVECVLCVMWVNFVKLCTSVYMSNTESIEIDDALAYPFANRIHHSANQSSNCNIGWVLYTISTKP